MKRLFAAFLLLGLVSLPVLPGCSLLFGDTKDCETVECYCSANPENCLQDDEAPVEEASALVPEAAEDSE